ncbi:MAG: glutathione-dependent disulfide-bond oxidoreductase, partial [Pseudomonas sp.]
HEYTHVQRWAQEIAKRPAVIRGMRVNRTWGDEATQVPERHQGSDLD